MISVLKYEQLNLCKEVYFGRRVLAVNPTLKPLTFLINLLRTNLIGK